MSDKIHIKSTYKALSIKGGANRLPADENLKKFFKSYENDNSKTYHEFIGKLVDYWDRSI